MPCSLRNGRALCRLVVHQQFAAYWFSFLVSHEDFLHDTPGWTARCRASRCQISFELARSLRTRTSMDVRPYTLIVWQRGDDLRCVASKSVGETRWNLRVTHRSRIVKHRAFRCVARALKAAHLWRAEFEAEPRAA